MNALTPMERLDDMFPDMFRRFMRPMKTAGLGADAPGEIRLDLKESDKSYEVIAELPGVKKEDIRVTIDGRYVSISAEVKRESEDEMKKRGERTVVKELFYGSASRGFSLPLEVDEKAAVAKFDNGILNLSLPKKQQANSRAVPVQ